MKMCKSCGGSGSFFGGVHPLRWATCIKCRGAGTIPAPKTDGIIIMRKRKGPVR